MAKIQEKKEDLAFEVIDSPQVPQVRSRPQRAVMVVMSFLFSFIAAIFLVLVKEYVVSRRCDHEV